MRCCTPGTPGCCASWTFSSPSSGVQRLRCWARVTAVASPWVRRWLRAPGDVGGRSLLLGVREGRRRRPLLAGDGAKLSLNKAVRPRALIPCLSCRHALGYGCPLAPLSLTTCALTWRGRCSVCPQAAGMGSQAGPCLPPHTQHRSTRLHPAGVENAFYEGPLRLRLPVAMQLDPDGAFSFELPLPSPEGNLSQVGCSPSQAASGDVHCVCCRWHLLSPRQPVVASGVVFFAEPPLTSWTTRVVRSTAASSMSRPPRPPPLQFVDGFKGLVIPSHLRPPAQAINWIPLTGDKEVDAAMQARAGRGWHGAQAPPASPAWPCVGTGVAATLNIAASKLWLGHS